MSTSFNVKGSEKKIETEVITSKQRSLPNPENSKFNAYNIREKIMDSLNSLKYGFILILIFGCSF